jgi:hypothetical protein
VVDVEGAKQGVHCQESKGAMNKLRPYKEVEGAS